MITLALTICTALASCFNAASNVNVSLNLSTHEAIVSIAGKGYRGPAQFDVAATFAVNATLYASDGTSIALSTAFQHWATRTVSGRGQMYVQHFELLGGSLQ